MKQIPCGSGQEITEVQEFKSPSAETSLAETDKTNLKPPTIKKMIKGATVSPLPGQPTDTEEGPPKVDC